MPHHFEWDVTADLLSDSSASSSFIVCRFLLIVDNSTMIASLNLSLQVALSAPTHNKQTLFSVHLSPSSLSTASVLRPAAFSGKRNVTVWRPSFRPSVCLSRRHILTATHQRRGQRTFRPSISRTDILVENCNYHQVTDGATALS